MKIINIFELKLLKKNIQFNNIKETMF